MECLRTHMTILVVCSTFRFCNWSLLFFFFFQAEDGIRDVAVTAVQTCALPIGVAARPLLAPKAKEAMDRALQALNDNKLDEADKFLDITAKLAPNHPDVLYLQGVIFLRRNQSEKAQPVLEKATQIDPKNAHAFSALGMAFVNESRYDLAIAPLQQSVQLNPDSWDTHYTLAKAFYHQEQFDDALKESQLALAQSHGTEPAIELLLAQTQTAVGKYEDSAGGLRLCEQK